MMMTEKEMLLKMFKRLEKENEDRYEEVIKGENYIEFNFEDNEHVTFYFKDNGELEDIFIRYYYVGY